MTFEKGGKRRQACADYAHVDFSDTETMYQDSATILCDTIALSESFVSSDIAVVGSECGISYIPESLSPASNKEDYLFRIRWRLDFSDCIGMQLLCSAMAH